MKLLKPLSYSITIYNLFAEAEGKEIKEIKDLKNEVVALKIARQLLSQLSPEIISCDGALNAKERNKKRKEILLSLNQLSEISGQDFSEIKI
jgi:hypothetical protein